MREEMIPGNGELAVSEIRDLIQVTNTLARALTKDELIYIMQVYDRVITRLLASEELKEK